MTDDRGVALKQFGPESGKINLVVSVADQPTAGTGIAVALHDCATDGGTFKPTGIGVAAAIPNATLVVGYTMLNVALKPDVMRVLRIVYTTTGNHTGSAGKINAGLVFGAMSEDVTPYRA
ncbi:MAG: hypothetical protein Q8J68_14805 [Methanolobus sp.]|nr:hypothetical protein [Methanolobus sp.]MDP2218545.1 hypothetical protein [Methanolobus sp.]